MPPESRRPESVPYYAVFSQAKCSGEGGKFGTGWAYARADIREYGKSGTEYFKIIFITKYFGVDSRWHEQLRGEFKSRDFPDDFMSYNWAASRTQNFGPDWVGLKAYFVRFEWWNDRPVIRDKLVFFAEVETVQCDAAEISG